MSWGLTFLEQWSQKKPEEAQDDGPMEGWRVRQINRVRERQSQRKRDRDRDTEKDREMSKREVRVRHTESEWEREWEKAKKIIIVVSLNLIKDLLYILKSKNSNCIYFLSYGSTVWKQVQNWFFIVTVLWLFKLVNLCLWLDFSNILNALLLSVIINIIDCLSRAESLKK